ncbi:hypothetical protein ACSSV4_001511 [Roseovarius sp. MBR-154]|jgi:hypothetical protein
MKSEFMPHAMPTELPSPVRHARLFELIRQDGLARQVHLRLAQQMPPDPSQLRRFAAGAHRSLHGEGDLRARR